MRSYHYAGAVIGLLAIVFGTISLADHITWGGAAQAAVGVAVLGSSIWFARIESRTIDAEADSAYEPRPDDP